MRKLSVLLLFLAAFMAPTVSVRSQQEDDGAVPVLVEVPGYAKLVRGTYGAKLLGHSLYTHRPFYSFLQMKYAAAPTKENRFLPAKPINYPYPDDEIYNAIGISPGCPQGDYIKEDCLLVSVHTPYIPGNVSDPNTRFDKNLPVVFWIHGGSFSVGKTISYQPQTFMEKDIVVVEVQYRLGPLGWLSLDTDEVPGNAGMFDMIEGLRWVNKFIKYFGGDPDKVTIMGESAGAASVGLLMIAPQAQGLFRYIIAESGSMFAEWALDRKPKENGLTISKYAGCPLEPYEVLLDCLRNVDVLTLKRAQGQYADEDGLNGGLGCGGSAPVVQVAGKERVLVRHPKDILEQGDYNTNVTIFFGANKHEGAYMASYIYSGYLVPNELVDDQEYLKYDFVADMLRTLTIVDDTRAFSDAIYEKYFGYAAEEGQEGNFTYLIPGLIDFSGAVLLKAGGWETVRLHSRHNPGHAYWYSFDYRGRRQMLGTEDIIPPGVSHADELMYLWNIPFPHNTSELNMCLRMQETWTNFIIYGNPTPDDVPLMNGIPKFPAYTAEDKWFMAINEKWEVRSDYTRYYTVSVDDLYPERKRKLDD